MRVIIASGLLLSLAACNGGPQALGITGPGASTPVAPAETSPDGMPTIGNSSSYGAPSPTSTGPTTGSTRFWGYN